MNALTVVVAIIALFIAFRAGSAHRHHRRTWSDHKVTRTGERALRRLRWTTLGAVIGSVAIMIAFIVVVSVLGLHVASRPASSATPSTTTPSTAPAAAHTHVTAHPAHH